ncbi:MAG: DNA repair protein RecO [Anaeroplasma sp.]
MKSIGIVYKTIDYKETSKIVYLYTPNGKVSIKALGALKIKNGLLPFVTIGNVVSFVSNDDEFKTLLEFNLEKGIINYTEDLSVMKSFGVIIEIINNLPDDIDNYKVFNYILKTLEWLSIDNKKALAVFLIKMLYVFGVAPNLKKCNRCDSNINLGFNPITGYSLCNNCGNYDKELYSIWNNYYYLKTDDISNYLECDYNALFKSIKEYYKEFTGIIIKNI